MKIANIIGFAGSVILTLSITVWIAPFFSVIMPLPFLFYFSKLGVKEGLTTGIITLLLVGLLGAVTGQPDLILHSLMSGFIGLIISELFKKRFSIGGTVFWGTAFTLSIGLIYFFLISMTNGEGIFATILEYYKPTLNQFSDLYKNMGLDKEKITQIMQVISGICPSLIIVEIGFEVWIVVVLSKSLFRSGGLNYPDFKDLSRWSASEFMVWGIIGAGFALFLPTTGIKFVAANILVVLSAIYIFQGLAILIFFFNKYGVPGWARVWIYFLTLQLFFLLAFVGFFDQWADFRKIHIKIDPESV
jgi:uncharacterized protein YybS (DUF2232 family)